MSKLLDSAPEVPVDSWTLGPGNLSWIQLPDGKIVIRQYSLPIDDFRYRELESEEWERFKRGFDAPLRKGEINFSRLLPDGSIRTVSLTDSFPYEGDWATKLAWHKSVEVSAALQMLFGEELWEAQAAFVQELKLSLKPTD